MEHYLVVYMTGHSGQWLTWFIDQHKNFPKYKTYLECNENGACDYKSPGTHWLNSTVDSYPDHESDGEFDVSNFDSSFETYTKSWIPLYTQDISSTKNALQLIEYHELWMKSKDEISAIVNEINPAGIIVVYIDPSNTWTTPIENRSHNLFKNVAPAWATIETTKTITWEWYSEIYVGRFFDFLSDKYRLHYLNIGNILDCDINEYKSLLEFIDEEPINNYEYLTKDMIEKVYKKYV